MLGTTGHHGGQATGRTVNQSKGVGVPRAVSEFHGTGWAGPGDGDIVLPGKAWELSNCVCRGLLEVRAEIWGKHLEGDARTHGRFLRRSQGSVSQCRGSWHCPVGRSDGGCVGLIEAPASLARSCLDPVARAGRPRTGPVELEGRGGTFPGRAGQRAALGPGSTLEGLWIPNLMPPSLLTPHLHG